MKNLKQSIIASVLCLAFVAAAYGQTTEFTYQGRFSDITTTQPTNGTYQMQFALFDAVGAGNQIGSTLNIATVQVTNGIFTVSLNFGTGAFTGPARFLQISVFSQTSSNFVPLNPRQALTSTPYAIKALNADTAVAADDAANLDGVPADQYVQTSDPRMTNDRNPTPGSDSYIQNRTTPQTATNFNVDGNGTVGGTLTGDVINSGSQYNIGNSRVLSVFGSNNTFTGFGTGPTNTGTNNSFFGRSAGFDNTIGAQNSFFGSFAGANNTTGGENSFYGSGSGDTNTTGSLNSFFGRSAGSANTTGGSNTFIGRESGFANTSGYFNSFVGRNAGDSNTTGFQNTFFGTNAGFGNVSGSNNTYIGYNAGSSVAGNSNNTFIGTNAGNSSTSGSNNTLIGYNVTIDAKSGFVGSSVGIGFGAVVTESNTIVLGGGQRILTPGSIYTERSLFAEDVVSARSMYVDELFTGGSIPICLRPEIGGGLSFCSSSRRYKTNIAPFNSNLTLINRLNPVTFAWKSSGKADLGLVAEEVAEVEPLLVTYQNGQVEGVKYDRIGVALINAVKEQQTQIEQLRQQIESLKTLLCSQNTNVAACNKQ